MDDQWISYDPIARLYSRYAEPSYFAGPAKDLLAMLAPAPGSWVLDVGAGTGAAAAAASKMVGTNGVVVAADGSLGMLLECRRRLGRSSVVVSTLPSLACRRQSFDAVTACFVLTHVEECEAALEAIRSVLRPGAGVGISSWSAGVSATAPGKVFQTTIDRYIDGAVIEAAMRDALPWENRFSDRDEIERALDTAGFSEIRSTEVSYEVELTTAEYLESRLLAFPSRVLASSTSPEQWESFRAEAARRLDEAFGSRVAFTIRANLAVAKRSAGALPAPS